MPDLGYYPQVYRWLGLLLCAGIAALWRLAWRKFKLSYTYYKLFTKRGY